MVGSLPQFIANRLEHLRDAIHNARQVGEGGAAGACVSVVSSASEVAVPACLADRLPADEEARPFQQPCFGRDLHAPIAASGVTDRREAAHQHGVHQVGCLDRKQRQRDVFEQRQFDFRNEDMDVHVHIFITEVKLALLENIPLTLLAVQASNLMHAMLMRGFTTIRDTGRGDWGMKIASETGLLEGPRLFICGQAISQTGGHGDFRRRTYDGDACPCCAALSYLSRIVDGVPEMLKAVRDELRKGADHIKLMVSGGVASPNDPLDSLQFTLDEIRAAVGEATSWKRYVCAHAYGADAIARAVECGVRSIEHGN